MPHATHDAAYFRAYRAQTRSRVPEPPTWRELGGRMPGGMVEALLDGINRCSPEPLREWRRTRATPSPTERNTSPAECNTTAA